MLLSKRNIGQNDLQGPHVASEGVRNCAVFGEASNARLTECDSDCPCGILTRYGPRTILLLVLCLFGALLPIFVQRRCLPTRGSAGQLPTRLSAASEQLHPLQKDENGMVIAYPAAGESPRTGAKLTVRQQSGVGRQYIINGAALSGDVSDDIP